MTALVRNGSVGLLVILGCTIFLANAGLLILQLLAGRYLSPFIGSSVETWTCVIAVFLSGIALGNAIGGRLADRSPKLQTLAGLMFLSAVLSLSLMGGAKLVASTGFDQVFGLTARIPVLTILFCLPPAFVLSALTPLTIKLAMPDVGKAGRIAGLVFALSTLGCLVGNYATGFWFMAEYSLDTISLGVAGCLALLGGGHFLLSMFLKPVPVTTSSQTPSPTVTPNLVEDPLGFRTDIRRAFALVFFCSFCGMSLELVATRVLAPVHGVSLFTWTGVIGVMLAGTALGNYVGGVLADRGAAAAKWRIALIFTAVFGIVLVPDLFRQVGLVWDPLKLKPYWEGSLPGAENLAPKPESVDPTLRYWLGTTPISFMTLRIMGIGVAWAAVGGAYLISRSKYGREINLFLISGIVGILFIPSVIQSIDGLLKLPTRDPITNEILRESWSNRLGLPVMVGIGFVVGGILGFALMYEKNSERRPLTPATILGRCLFLAGLGSSMALLLSGLFQRFHYGALFTGDLVNDILGWTFLLFFTPMFALGTISPQVIRIALKDSSEAGRTAGSIYAWSTVGAIVGTIATGYFLIGLFGTTKLLLLFGFLLTVAAVIIGRFWRESVMLYAMSIVGGGSFIGIFVSGFYDRVYLAESKYYAIYMKTDVREVVEEGQLKEIKTREFFLDALLHSALRVDDPTWLHYKHEEVQGEIIRSYRDPNRSTSVLIIGGGGYTLPRWLDILFPDVKVDVVEIDPKVTEMAFKHLHEIDIRQTRIQAHHLDGRQFIREKAPPGHFHLVLQDAVNDLSVPTHLMTREYNQAIKRTLTPDGAYLLTIIESIEDGLLWRSAVKTLQQDFKYVELLYSQPFGYNWTGRDVYVIYASDTPFDLEKVTTEARKQVPNRNPPLEGGLPKVWTHQLDRATFDKLLNKKEAPILTDQYAPVDNIMMEIFRNKNKYTIPVTLPPQPSEK